MIPGTTAGKPELNDPSPMKMTRIIAVWVGFQKSSAFIRTLFLMSLFLATGMTIAGCAVVGPELRAAIKERSSKNRLIYFGTENFYNAELLAS